MAVVLLRADRKEIEERLIPKPVDADDSDGDQADARQGLPLIAPPLFLHLPGHVFVESFLHASESLACGSMCLDTCLSRVLDRLKLCVTVTPLFRLICLANGLGLASESPALVVASCSDEDDDDDDDEDDTAELMAELERIKKERAEEKARKVCTCMRSRRGIRSVQGRESRDGSRSRSEHFARAESRQETLSIVPFFGWRWMCLQCLFLGS